MEPGELKLLSKICRRDGGARYKNEYVDDAIKHLSGGAVPKRPITNELLVRAARVRSVLIGGGGKPSIVMYRKVIGRHMQFSALATVIEASGSLDDAWEIASRRGINVDKFIDDLKAYSDFKKIFYAWHEAYGRNLKSKRRHKY